MDIEKLVKKAQKGNDKAYLQLFQHFEEVIYRTAYVHVGNKEDALDVIQETACLSPYFDIHTQLKRILRHDDSVPLPSVVRECIDEALSALLQNQTSSTPKSTQYFEEVNVCPSRIQDTESDSRIRTQNSYKKHLLIFRKRRS